MAQSLFASWVKSILPMFDRRALVLFSLADFHAVVQAARLLVQAGRLYHESRRVKMALVFLVLIILASANSAAADQAWANHRVQPRHQADPVRQLLRLPRPGQQSTSRRTCGWTRTRGSSTTRTAIASWSRASRQSSELFKRHDPRETLRTDAAGQDQEGTDQKADRAGPTLDRTGGQVSGPLVAAAAAQRPVPEVKNKAWPRMPSIISFSPGMETGRNLPPSRKPIAARSSAGCRSI